MSELVVAVANIWKYLAETEIARSLAGTGGPLFCVWRTHNPISLA